MTSGDRSDSTAADTTGVPPRPVSGSPRLTDLEGVAALLNPRSIVVVGASDRSRWSAAIVSNLAEGGFVGEVQLVNSRSATVHGRPAARSCAELQAPPDLGVVMVPAHAAVDAVAELGAAGARSAVVLTSGFAETGPVGRGLQDELTAAARAAGVRLLGPNSLGFLSFARGARAWATPVKAPSTSSGVAVVSQSGATAYFLTNLAYRQDIGLSYVVATGNEADIDGVAVARHLVDDPSTRAIAMFVETVRDPAGFIMLARAALSAGKPLVVLKVGSSEATARSAVAHTGALVGDDRAFDAVCEQFGVIRVGSIEDLMVTADILGRTGELGSGGLCLASNSGGICEIAADAAGACGIALPELSGEAERELTDLLPAYGTPHNPLDLTGGIVPENCEQIVHVLARQPECSAILVPFYPVPASPEERSPRLTELHRGLAAGLTRGPVPGFIVSYHDTDVSELSRQLIAEHTIPYLACGLDRAIRALARGFWWADRRREARPPRPSATPPSDERPRSEPEALDFLVRRGVPVVPGSLVTTERQAVAAAQRLGGPVALKIASPDIAHKSEIGGVALDLLGEDAVRRAFRRVLAAGRAQTGARIAGVLVSAMRTGGIELFVGCSRDPQWGPLLAVGLGGVWVEVLQDVALRLLPIDARDVRAMLGRLRGARLLSGHRGHPAADVDAVAAAVAAIGDAALALGPSLEALDVNPLWVSGDHVEVLDALVVWDEDRLTVAPAGS